MPAFLLMFFKERASLGLPYGGAYTCRSKCHGEIGFSWRWTGSKLGHLVETSRGCERGNLGRQLGAVGVAEFGVNPTDAELRYLSTCLGLQTVANLSESA